MNTELYKHWGRMNDPVASAYVKGICGDEMEFYLVIQDERIELVRFFTDGCDHTRICGETAALLAEGRSLEEALEVSPGAILRKIGDLPEDHIHCTILAALTLQKALADYLYRKYSC